MSKRKKQKTWKERRNKQTEGNYERKNFRKEMKERKGVGRFYNATNKKISLMSK